MIGALNQLVQLVEETLTETIDVEDAARKLGTTEYHLRSMFSSLSGLPLSEYVRRRRMTVAAGDLIRGERNLLDIATRYGYSSAEAFGRAFRSVHGASPGDVRRDGGPLRTQARLEFELKVSGTERMKSRIVDQPAFHLVGHAARVPLVHRGINTHILEHITALPAHAHERLKSLGNTSPAGLLAVCADLDPDRAEGSELTYVHGVAVSIGTPIPSGLDVTDVPAGRWVAFDASGAQPETLQATWAAAWSQWLPSNPWQLRRGPEIVSRPDESGSPSDAAELWLPLEASNPEDIRGDTVGRAPRRIQRTRREGS